MDDLLPEHDQATATYDKLAEQSVLGSMMLNRDAVWEVAALLVPTDFHDLRHEDIARAIVGLAHRNLPTDPISVTEELTKTGKLARVGGAEYLHELHGIPMTWTNVGFYADIVKQRAIRRKMVIAGETVANFGRSGVGDVFEHVETARTLMDDLAKSTRVDVKPIGDSFQSMIESMEQPPAMVATPWSDLDAYLGGLRPGKLYVVGARPAMGKSIVALQLARKLATKGNVAFASLEMDEDEIQKRLLAQYAEVNFTSLMNGTLTSDDWKRIAEARPNVVGAPIYISDAFAMNITQVKAFARSVARRGELSGVVVDYLQLMTATDLDRTKDRHLVVGEISRQLKIMSRELNVPVVALSQLNRGPETRKSGEPSLADLRESGSIEQDADAVLLLHRDDKDRDRRHLLKVIVAKNRSGRTGSIELIWQGQYARVLQKKVSWSPTRGLDEEGKVDG